MLGFLFPYYDSIYSILSSWIQTVKVTADNYYPVTIDLIVIMAVYIYFS